VLALTPASSGLGQAADRTPCWDRPSTRPKALAVSPPTKVDAVKSAAHRLPAAAGGVLYHGPRSDGRRLDPRRPHSGCDRCVFVIERDFRQGIGLCAGRGRAGPISASCMAEGGGHRRRARRDAPRVAFAYAVIAAGLFALSRVSAQRALRLASGHAVGRAPRSKGWRKLVSAGPVRPATFISRPYRRRLDRHAPSPADFK